MANKTFVVRLRGVAVMKGSLRVKAKSAKEAEDIAARDLGDVLWEYDGLESLTEAVAIEDK